MDRQRLEKSNIDNLTHLWKLMGAYTHEINAGNVMHASIHSPYRVWLDWGYHPKSEDIEIVLSTIERNSRNAVVPLWHETDIQLSSALYTNGYKLLFEQTAMALYLRGKNKYAKSNLELREVTTHEYAIIWTDIASLSFGYDIHAPIIQKIIGAPRLKLILAFLNAIPIGTGLVFENSGVSGIHMVGVAPAHRRQGMARKIMHGLIDICHQSDSAYVTLQASAMAKPLYAQLGFEEQFTILNFGNSKFNGARGGSG